MLQIFLKSTLSQRVTLALHPNGMCTYLLLRTYVLFTGDRDVQRSRSKRAFPKARPAGSRSGPPRDAHKRGSSQRAAGGSRNVHHEDDFVDEIEEEQPLVEDVPETHFKKLPRKIWRTTRMINPYERYPQRTCGDDPRFWTNFQAKAWEEWYMTLKEAVVEQKALDEEYYNNYVNSSFCHINSTLDTMDILKLALIKQSYYPELISKFYCTVAFKDDTLRTMT
jgi:hypothetical protein